MPQEMSPTDRAKRASALKALEFVEDGMRLGLGTGSTAVFFVEALAERAKAEGLTLTCVPTSSATRDLAGALGLNVVTLNEAGRLDLTVDGADEFDPELNLIKGGGGALLQEKIVATASERMLVISDNGKAVDILGKFPLPVEVVRFGWEVTRARLLEVLSRHGLAGEVVRRHKADEVYLTDEGHYILDCHLGRIPAPADLSTALVEVPGVVESGLFVGIADRVALGYASGEARIVEASRG